MSNHGIKLPRGMEKYKAGRPPENGRFGVLFPHLPRLISDPADLKTAGKPAGAMDEGTHGAIGTTSIPLGYVFLGQFIDHDITLDVTSSFDKINDPEATKNFRTPALDLDCIYGSGPEASRHLYYHAPPKDIATDRQKKIDKKHLLTTDDDLVRALSENKDNPNQAALIGDPRNDENRIVSQLQLIMHKFHNQVVDYLLKKNEEIDQKIKDCKDVKETKIPDKEIFEEAQRLTRWHYQWVVVHDFLGKMVDKEEKQEQGLVDDILCNGRKIFCCEEGKPFIPIEFATAAYRFGHTMVPMRLHYNKTFPDVTLFGKELGTGFQVNHAGLIDWEHFFGSKAQKAGAVDTRLPSDLLKLPFISEGESSLATRNLLRGQSFGLPSGQNVHAAISEACGYELPKPDLSKLNLPASLEKCTPLWLYILAEGSLSKGNHLGPVGGRIIAEVLIGILECDPTSYLGSDRSWSPTFAKESKWNMETLIDCATNGIK